MSSPYRITILLMLGVHSIALLPRGLAAQDSPPYPSSPVIAGIDWAAKETIIRKAKGGDNWPLTWADDDALYSTYGDGWGFNPKVPEKLSLGLVRVTGDADQFRGVNLRSASIEKTGAGRKGEKAWGLVCVEGQLLMWMGHANRNGGSCRLAWSNDHGSNWQEADWQFDEFGLVGFINFGRDYAGARDTFLYAYSHDGPNADTPSDQFVLMRVPIKDVKQRSAWEFFKGTDADGTAQWTRNANERGAVFSHRDACLRSAITYNAGIDRYLWWQAIPQPPGHPDRGDTRFDGGFAIYDAPEPWGPWTTAFYTRKWDTGPGEHGDFPSKWISSNGRTMHLVFSGDDCFSVRKATIQIRD